MKIQISRNEMRVLGYLHEHAKGFDDRFMFQPNALITSLSITSEDLSRDTSFLAEHNLVKHPNECGSRRHKKCQQVVTHRGEACWR
jgi:hypothetical protein